MIYDIIFTQVFNDYKCINVLERFISDYFEIPINEVRGNIEILPRQTINNNKNDARKELDLILNMKDKNNKIINKIQIELNTTSISIYDRIKDRNLVFASNILSRQYKKGDRKLRGIKKVHQINITNFKCNEKKFINEYLLRERDNTKDIYSDKIQIDQIDVSKCGEICYNEDERSKKIAKWCKLFNEDNIKEFAKISDEIMNKEESQTLIDRVQEISEDEEIYPMLKTLDDDRITEEDIEYIKEKAIQEGLERGIENRNIEIAKEMLKDKISIDTISKYVNISPNKIAQLIK